MTITIDDMRQTLDFEPGVADEAVIEAYALYLAAAAAAAPATPPVSRDPFVRAVDVLFYAAGSCAAIYTPAGGSPLADPIRVIATQPDEIVGFGAQRAIVATNIFRIRRSDIARPDRNSTVAIGADLYRLQGDAKLDVKRLVWTVGAELVE